MEVTGVGRENYEYFSPFTGELKDNQGVLGLIDDDYAVGAAVFTRDGDACFLDSIYVEPDYRRRGGGALLVQSAMEAMKDVGVDTYMAYYIQNDEVTSFLEGIGFTCTPDSIIHTFDVNDVFASRKVLKLANSRISPDIFSFSELQDNDYKYIASQLVKYGYSDELIKASNLEKGLSFVEKRNGEPISVLLARIEDRQAFVTLLLSFGVSNHVTIPLLSAYLNCILRNQYNISEICFLERTQKVYSLVSTLVDGKGKPVNHQMWSAVKFDL